MPAYLCARVGDLEGHGEVPQPSSRVPSLHVQRGSSCGEQDPAGVIQVWWLSFTYADMNGMPRQLSIVQLV
jgi:hypothetical protein